jgi:hypothetical protein
MIFIIRYEGKNNNLGDPDVDGRIILIRKLSTVRTGFKWLRMESSTGYYEDDIKP